MNNETDCDTLPINYDKLCDQGHVYKHCYLCKIFTKVHNLESMCFINLQSPLHPVSQSGQGSQLTICCQTCIISNTNH